MELKFTKDALSGNYVSELEAKAGFNLHIEGAKKLRLYQRTAGSRYDEIEGEYKNGPYSFDYDFDALVYPKFIKIVSETEPTYAEVVSDGEITEIKSQTKEVEITANGTTQVAPDAGYSYLTGVTVKTNVPQNGGSGEGGGKENGNVLYLSPINSNDSHVAEMIYYARSAKVKNSIIAPTIYLQGFGHLTSLSDLNSICIDLNDPFIISNDPSGGKTIKDILNGTAEMLGQNNYEELLASYFRFITEEEFYNLDS